MCRTVAVPSTQEAKQKKKSKAKPASRPFRPYARRDAPSQESHTFRLYTCNSKQKAFENNVIVSSLQRDPYPLPSARSQSFRPRLRCVCLLGDAMCMVNFFFFFCLVTYNSLSVHSLAQRPRSKCPSCYFVALFDVVFVRADDRKKKTFCAVHGLLSRSSARRGT